MEKRSITGALRNFNSESGIATFVASTETKDRHGSVVNQDGWDLEKFNKNPVIGYQHELYGAPCEKSDPDDIIGKGKAWLEGEGRAEGDEKRLMVDIEFDDDPENTRAQKVKRKVEKGFLNTVSVGFIPVGEPSRGRVNEEGDVIDEDTLFFKGQELLEISVVNIPSNPDAVQNQIRSRAYDAISFIAKQAGGDLTYSEIERMTVRDCIDVIEKVATVEDIRKKLDFSIEKKEAAEKKEETDDAGGNEPKDVKNHTTSLQFIKNRLDLSKKK